MPQRRSGTSQRVTAPESPTVYFSQRTQHGAGHAMTVSVAVVSAIAVLCVALAWLLPRSAPDERH